MGRARAWTPEEYEQFKVECSEGMSVADMAQKHARTELAISVARSKLKHDDPKLFMPRFVIQRRNAWTPELHKELIRLWNNTNMTQREIGEAMGRTERAINRQVLRLRREGVQMVDRKVPGRGPWRGRLKLPEHTHPLVRRLFDEMNKQMTTCEEVAARVGVHHETVGKWRRRHPPDLLNLDAAYTALGLELCVRRIKEAA